MMEKGNGADFQGKTLEQIDIHLESLNDGECSKLENTNGKFLQESANLYCMGNDSKEK